MLPGLRPQQASFAARVGLLILFGIASSSRGHAAEPETAAGDAVTMNLRWAEEAFSAAASGGAASNLKLDDLVRRAVAEPALPFSFVYGGRPSAALLGTWSRRVESETIDAGRRRRTLTLADPATRLEVRAVCTVYADTPGVDWVLHFTNRGEKDTPALEEVKALDVVLPFASDAPVLRRLKGSTCAADDWMPFDETLAPGRTVEFGAVNGRSSADSPFFEIASGTGGVIAAVGWSGQWRATVARGDGAVRLTAGMQNLHLCLRPGETIRTPRILLLRWAGSDPFLGYNLFRRTMLAHVLPRRAGTLVLPPIAHLSTAFYEMNTSTESNVLSHLRAIEGLGFEMFWLDAYWTRDGFPAGMGHYGFPIERVEPRDRFPAGLAPIREAVRRANMGFLMWFEPERVHPGTTLAREHPQWVISPGGDGGGLFNLGIPAARDYMTRYLKTVVAEYGLECLRIDYNIDPLPFWQHLNAKDPARVGTGEIRYIEGLYRMWGELLEAHPRLFIDNCASGGRRIDLETCSRSIPLWRSDNTCDMTSGALATVMSAAIKNQAMSAGLNRYLPYSTVGQMGATPYLFRSGFNGGIAFAEDCRPPGFPRDLLRQAIAEGKRIRRYWLGDFHPLSEATLDPTAWCALQYHRPADGDGVLVFFRRERSPYSSFDAEPKGIDPAAQYELRQSPGYQPAPPSLLTGAALQRFRAVIEEKPGSLLVEYRKTGR